MGGIVFGSLLLSIWQSILFFRQNLGLSVALFVIPAVCFILYILNKNEKLPRKEALFLCIPIFLLSCTYFIFNNAFFKILNIFVIFAIFAIMLIWATNTEEKISFWLTKGISILLGPIEYVGKTFALLHNGYRTWFKTDNKEGKKNMVKKIGKALIFAIPILILVMLLLISADTVFANLFSGISSYFAKIWHSVEFVYLVLRIVLIGIIFIYFVSFIYNLLDKHSSYNVVEDIKRKKEIKIERFTINTIATLLNVIYFVFCIIQFSYLFMGADMHQGFNYAEYARQGYFQLMAVSVINFIFLMISTMNRSEETNKSRNYRKVMNLLLALFTMIILVSSAYRMNLYEKEFGYTYLRLLVYFSLATEMILIIPTIVYILNEKINLIKSYFCIIIGMYIIINFVNLDSMITKRNVDKYFADYEQNQTVTIDFQYLKNATGTDAIIQIQRLLKTKDYELKRQVKNYLIQMDSDVNQNRTFSEFNLSKNKAEKVIETLHLKP